MSQQELSREVQEIWTLFREVAKRQEETDKAIRGFHEGMKDLRELFTGQWGKRVESLVEPSVLRLFQARGIQVIDCATIENYSTTPCPLW
jgi:hypothetical protein